MSHYSEIFDSFQYVVVTTAQEPPKPSDDLQLTDGDRAWLEQLGIRP